jgi:hypothetical protein
MADLTQELFWKLNREQPRFPSGRVLFGQGGLTDSEIRSIEDQLEMALPPDFKFLLENLKDPGGVFFPWADFSLNLYRELIEWVWDGIAFDIGHGLWLDRWGRDHQRKPKRSITPDWTLKVGRCFCLFLATASCQPHRVVQEIQCFRSNKPTLFTTEQISLTIF